MNDISFRSFLFWFCFGFFACGVIFTCVALLPKWEGEEPLNVVISNPAESAQRQHTASVNTFSFTFLNTCLFDIAMERWNLYLKATRAHSCLHVGHACYMHTATPLVLKVFTPHAGEIHASSWIHWHPCLGEEISGQRRSTYITTGPACSLSHFESGFSE